MVRSKVILDSICAVSSFAISLFLSLLAPTEIRSVSLIGVEHTCSVYDNYNINCVVTNNG